MTSASREADVHVGREHRGDLKLTADVVIVGSGAGGAVVARLLAEAGERVVVLEEGPHVPLSKYRQMRPSQHLRSVWRDGGMTLAVGVGDTPTINVTMGRCVGGSSMLTGGVCCRTP
ncbi:MAG: NAD(P)-binding protein, partial [Polyangiaceae bacterium]